MNQLKIVLSACLMFSLSACSMMFDRHVEWEYIEPDSHPVITAIGYAPIDAQMGEDKSTKMLRAIKASKLDAYRELTEQVYGQKVNGDQSLANLVLTNTSLKSSIEGVVRGARVVKSYPVGEDTYATELELNFEQVHNLYLSTARPKRIKEIKYF